MSQLLNLFGERRTANLSGLDEVVAALSERRMLSTWSGAPVSWDTALRHQAVWSSVGFIADHISPLPFQTFQDRGGRQVKVADAPLVVTPDPEMSEIGWRRQILVSLLMRGNGYGLVMGRDRLGHPTVIRIVHPDSISARREGKLGTIQWKFESAPLSPDELWRVTGYETPGTPIGMSPIRYVAQTIGLGLSAQKFGAQYFDDGGVPTALLTTDQALTEDTARLAKERWMAGANTREPRVLGAGFKFDAIQVAPEESQFLDTIQANGGFIASMFGLKPEDIGYKSADSKTYANVEQRQIDKLVYPMFAWIRRLEDALTRSVPAGLSVRANIDALVRVDLATRYRAHDSALRAGWKSRNEIRDLEDLAPIPDGDEYLWPPYRAFPIEKDDSE